MEGPTNTVVATWAFLQVAGDIYGAGFELQWIDVTDVEDGTYYLVVRANYEFIPDALGREEMDYDNNHAAVHQPLTVSGLWWWNTWEVASPFTTAMGCSLAPPKWIAMVSAEALHSS